MKKNKKIKHRKVVNYSLTGSILRGVIIGIIGFVFFLSIFSILILIFNIPSDNFIVMVLVASALSVIVSFLTVSNLICNNKLIAGMLSVFIVTIIQFFILLCFNNIDLSVKVYLMFPVNLVVAFIGSIICSIR